LREVRKARGVGLAGSKGEDERIGERVRKPREAERVRKPREAEGVREARGKGGCILIAMMPATPFQ